MSISYCYRKVRTQAPEIYTHELIEVIFNQPYCKIAILEEKKSPPAHGEQISKTIGRAWNSRIRNRRQGDTL